MLICIYIYILYIRKEDVKFNYLLDYKNLWDARSRNVSDGDITFLDLIKNKTSCGGSFDFVFRISL